MISVGAVARSADLLGLLLFVGLFLYFLQKPPAARTKIETLFLVLTGGAAIIDSVFFLQYLLELVYHR